MKATTAIAQIPRTQLERLALNMRRRARNQAADQERMRTRLVSLVFGAAGAGGVGYIMGGRQERGESTEWGGVDMELVIGGVGTLSGIFLQGRTGGLAKFGEWLEGGANGVLYYYIGSRAEAKGAEASRAA